MRLRGKRAVITGGNSGIGLAVARAFKHDGARVAIFGRDTETLRTAASELGDDVVAVSGDVIRTADLDRLFAASTEKFGEIDVLFANAGVAKFAPLEEFTEELFDDVCGVNFKGLFFTVQRALPHLRQGSSVILTSASGATSHGIPLTSVYNATKAAVRSLARTLSAELIGRGIRVNVLSPGMTRTPIIERDDTLSPELKKQIAASVEERVPLKRMGTPEDMTGAAVFLASDESAYCVGMEITVDGGLCQL